MIITLFGPPGCGKGTYAEILSKRGFFHISTGHILRNLPDTERWSELKKQISLGYLAKDTDVIEIMEEYIPSLGNIDIMLDGSPRTTAEAHWFNKNYPIDKVFHLDISKELCIERITKRAISSNRVDDTSEIAAHRYEIYKEQTYPVLDILGNRINIDASGSIQEVIEEIEKHL